MNALICSQCHTKFSHDEKIWRCECGGFLDIEFRAEFPIARIEQRRHTMWRYREALPITDDRAVVTLDEGFSPLTGFSFDGREVLLKQDYLFPTGSFKDRGSSVLVSKLKELGIERVVEDSSGNAGASIAAYSARAGIACEIYVPEQTSPTKMSLINLYGAQLHEIPGTRDQTAEACQDAAQEHFYASHYWNPFFLHGTKTMAFEVCEQLDWRAPDTVILPVGNGSLMLGVYIGFSEMLGAGIINQMPRLVGVQDENCAPVAAAFKRDLDYIPDIKAQATIAEGIAVQKPLRGRQILDAVRMTGGDMLTVHFQDIRHALLDMLRKGFLIEPTAAVCIAGIRKYLNHAAPNEVIVSAITGHGCKTIDKILSVIKG
jgi:threonine synthase